ncbi:MAG: methyltransferase RsmF C-terminal domain-like protein, partial [Bacteroidota bacterium]
LKAHWPKQVKILRDRISLWSKEGVPSQDLAHALGRRRTSALQSQLDAEGFDWHEIPLVEPLVSWYLQGQPLQMGDLRDGWNLITYQGLGLGWMHKNGVKVTNYFPKSRRIKR